MEKEEIKKVESSNNKENKKSHNGVFEIIGTLVIIGIIISLVIKAFSGGSEETNIYDKYKYTNWTSTNGYVLQLLDDTCQLGKDGYVVKAIKCEFDPNANNSGFAIVTLCSGIDCEKAELSYHHGKDIDSSIYIYGTSFHYTGKLSKK